MSDLVTKKSRIFKKGLLGLVGLFLGYVLANFVLKADHSFTLEKKKIVDRKSLNGSVGTGTNSPDVRSSRWKKNGPSNDYSIIVPLEQLLNSDDFTESKLNLRLFNDDLSPNEEVAEILGVDQEEIVELAQSVKNLSSQLAENDKIFRVGADQNVRAEFRVTQSSQSEKIRIEGLVRSAFEKVFPPRLAEFLVVTSINQQPFYLGGLSNENRNVRIEDLGSSYRVSTILGETDTIFQSAAQALRLEDLPTPYSSFFEE